MSFLIQTNIKSVQKVKLTKKTANIQNLLH